MTTEEAIEHLEKYIGNDCYTTKMQTVCKMAITALRAQQEENKSNAFLAQYAAQKFQESMTDFKEIQRLKTQLAALRDAEKNAPLTLDELREMDGEPVWVIPLAPEEQPEWALVDVMEEWLCTSNADYWGFEVYGRCILAYRRKPEV